MRQHVIRLVSQALGEDEPSARRVIAGRPKRKLASGVRDRLQSVEWRLSVLERRVGTGPDVGDLDRDIVQVPREKGAAIDAQDFENAAVLRDRERQLLNDRVARVQEEAALPSLTGEVERLRGEYVRRPGVDGGRGGDDHRVGVDAEHRETPPYLRHG